MMRCTIIAATALLLAGCTTFSPDGGFGRVGALTNERSGKTPAYQRSEADVRAAEARTAELLAQPLGARDAVELAYLGNRSLQASFAELGVAEADLVQAGRPRNPSLGFTRIGGGGITEIDRGLTFDLLGLLTLPLADETGRRRFEEAQLRAAAAAVALAADVQRSYYAALAAEQLAAYAEQVKDTAEAARDLAERMAAAGNFNALAQLREQAFYADATAGLARARQEAVARRERLARLLGLDNRRLRFRLPERLPDLPAQPLEPNDAEQTALDQRLDVQLARRSVEATARTLGLTKATRFVNVLEAGYQNKSQSGDTLQQGYEVRLELPIFDFGTANVARAEATYLQAMHRAAATAVDAQSQVREAYAAYRTHYDLARHYRDEIVPVRKRIADQNLLRYNGMLIDVFALLADAREQTEGVSGSIQALRDFWIADTDLRAALTGSGPSAAAAAP
jgi:outer membrane protein TolC